MGTTGGQASNGSAGDGLHWEDDAQLEALMDMVDMETEGAILLKW